MASKKDQPMLDPIAYREDYPEEAIIGGKANESFNQFGDDSDLAHQQQSLGGLSEKHEGESTFNYNKDANIKDLPSYVYGRDTAKQANGYITQRNDNIASALYNEGVTSKDAIVSYLASQEGWDNSSEMDRINTVEAIWKRMGQLGEPQKEEKKEGVDTSKMESDLNKSSNDVIYGKTTADSGNPEGGIKVNNDENLAYNIDAQARIANVKSLLLEDSTVIAASIIAGDAIKEQTLTDLQSWYPEKYQEIMNAKKQIIGQMAIDSITKGETLVTTSDTVDLNTVKTNAAVQNSSLGVGATQLLKAVDSALESNDTAKSAEDLMGSLEKDMATLKNRLLNLRKEANTVFKGDVPDYIVNAYINNKSQEIQNQLSILESRWESANNRYQKEADRALEREKIQIQKDNLELEWWKAKNTSSSTTTTSSQDGRMRTERNNNPTAMTTDYAKMMGLELGVDYEIGDSFIGGDGRTYYTARFLGDPVETAIKAFDRGAANNVFANEGGVLGHWHLGISNQKWLNMTDKEKREVIDKILQKEGGNMDNMSYYLDRKNTRSEDDLYYPEGWEDTLMKIANGTIKLNSATAKSYAEMMGTDVEGLGSYVENYQKKQLIEGKAAGKGLLNLMAELQIFFEDRGLNNGNFDTEYWDATGFGNVGGKHNQLIEQLKLNKVTEARDKGATFGQMTEYEWKVLEKAASALSLYMKTDKEYTDEFKKIMRATWIATFGKEPTEEEWQKYVNEQRAYQNFNLSANNTTTQTDKQKLDQIGTGNSNNGNGINFSSVVTNGK